VSRLLEIDRLVAMELDLTRSSTPGFVHCSVGPVQELLGEDVPVMEERTPPHAIYLLLHH
jgi:hypothetical protein